MKRASSAVMRARSMAPKPSIPIVERRSFLYNIRAPCPPRDLHKEEKWEHLARAVGLGYEGERMRLRLSEEEAAWAASWLRARGLEGPERPAGIFVGGRGRKGKRWPLERFLGIASLLVARGRRVLVFVGPEEAGLAGAIERALPAGARLVNEPSIRRAAALIARCALFITGDSGPLHLACALETPVLAIFLKENWRRWGPRPDRGRVLAGGEGLSPERVVEAAEEMLLQSVPPR
jgi:ADP-heptose:LPS heptosyltransferase